VSSFKTSHGENFIGTAQSSGGNLETYSETGSISPLTYSIREVFSFYVNLAMS
jgi:hypothetical protein